MKQLLFLLLFPCLALAQYQGNGNQKITLGEQTSADGLVYRGLAADTTRKPSVDTMAYILLDTNTNIIWQYKKAVNNAWTRVGGSISSGVTGVLPVANGGTGLTTFTAANRIPYASSATALTTSSNLTYDNNTLVVGNESNLYDNLILNNKATTSNTTRRVGMNVNTFENDSLIGILTVYADATARSVVFGGGSANKKNPTDITFYTSTNVENPLNRPNLHRMYISSNGDIGLGILSPTQRLHVVGNARITAMNGIGDIGASATGVLQAATSDMNLKNTIENSPFGLNEILLLNPVTFLYNDENRKIDSDVKEVGFIAQDVFDVIPNAVSSTGTGDLQLDYRAITATLTKAIQEQNALIKALEQRILILENK